MTEARDREGDHAALQLAAAASGVDVEQRGRHDGKRIALRDHGGPRTPRPSTRPAGDERGERAREQRGRPEVVAVQHRRSERERCERRRTTWRGRAASAIAPRRRGVNATNAITAAPNPICSSLNEQDVSRPRARSDGRTKAGRAPGGYSTKMSRYGISPAERAVAERLEELDVRPASAGVEADARGHAREQEKQDPHCLRRVPPGAPACARWSGSHPSRGHSGRFAGVDSGLWPPTPSRGTSRRGAPPRRHPRGEAVSALELAVPRIRPPRARDDGAGRARHRRAGARPLQRPRPARVPLRRDGLLGPALARRRPRVAALPDSDHAARVLARRSVRRPRAAFGPRPCALVDGARHRGHGGVRARQRARVHDLRPAADSLCQLRDRDRTAACGLRLRRRRAAADPPRPPLRRARRRTRQRRRPAPDARSPRAAVSPTTSRARSGTRRRPASSSSARSTGSSRSSRRRARTS